MSFISAYASVSTTLSYNFESDPTIPGYIFVNTTDTLAEVMAIGYLNGQTLLPMGFLGQTPIFQDGQIAEVNTSDKGIIQLQISTDNSSNINLVPLTTTFITSPVASSAPSLLLGTAYQNTLGYDVMLTVYLSITSALTASILLGIGPTSTPTQQTVVSGLTLIALGIVPVNIYLPSGYYAKLSTSGTISTSISGQIAMPI